MSMQPLMITEFWKLFWSTSLQTCYVWLGRYKERTLNLGYLKTNTKKASANKMQFSYSRNLNTPTFYILRMNFRGRIFFWGLFLVRSVDDPWKIHRFKNFYGFNGKSTKFPWIRRIPDGSRVSVSPCSQCARVKLTFLSRMSLKR